MTLPCTTLYEINYGDTKITAYSAKKTQGIPKHTHLYSHLVICTAGSLLIRKESVEKILLQNDAPISVKGNEWHELEALEDGTTFINIHKL